MTKENRNDTDVKRIAAFSQLFFLQQLARTGFLGVLLAVIADPTADKQHGHGDIGIDAKGERIKMRHDVTPASRASDDAFNKSRLSGINWSRR